jgi:tetratricopeptide (TPR) repeat protein/anti-sigma regulatory factor (Ser/Thr protein kinase)
MSSHVKTFRFFFLPVTLLFFQLTGYSQSNCGCPEYDILKAKQDESETSNKPAQEKLLALANSICKAKSYEWMAIDYSDEKKVDTAEIYFQKAEKIFKQSGCGDSVLLNTYKKWAELYYIKGDFAKTQEYSFKLLQSAEASGSPYEQAVCYTMIAQLLNQTGQADKGITYARKAIPFLSKIEKPSNKADVLFKLSKRYLWHYQDTKTVSSLDSSELFSMQQLTIARKINRSSSIAAAFSNLEGVAWEREDFKKALQLLDSSFKYTDSSNHATLSTNYYDKADLLIELKNFDAAEQMADSAMYYYKLSGNVPYIAETFELISRIAREKGDYKKAFETYELSRAITDSIRNVEKAKQVAELERKYSQAKNEQTIKELAQQKQIYLLFAIAGLMAAVAIAFFLRQQSLKHKQTILETEQRLNRARMNPHFFFNALASLQSFALRENDGKALASNLSKFSHIMRETLESTYKEYVTIEQEIEFLTEYLNLQQIRFPDKFRYEVTANETLETDELVIPSMIIQPFVENSIEHGFAGIDYPGHVRIYFSKEANEILIEVTDNGKGLLTTAKETNEHISRASQIIKDRIYLLNIKLKTKAGFRIDNNENGKGVTVKIHLPLIYKENINT